PAVDYTNINNGANLTLGSVTEGSVVVSASESAQVSAAEISNVASSGGSAFGEGKVTASNGEVATNQVLSSAQAYVTGAKVVASGDVDVDAVNNSQLTAVVEASSTTSGGGTQTAGSYTLAFNIVGWSTQNILYDSLDLLTGDASLLGTSTPADTVA